MIKSYQNNDINNELLQNINELKYNNYMNDINEDNLLDIYHKMNNKIQIKIYDDGEYKGELKNNMRDGKRNNDL